MRESNTYLRNPWLWVGIGGALLSVFALAGRSRLFEQPTLASAGERLQTVATDARSAVDRTGNAITDLVSTTFSLVLWSAALGTVILFVYAPLSRQRRDLLQQATSLYDRTRELATEAQRMVTRVQHRAA